MTEQGIVPAVTFTESHHGGVLFIATEIPRNDLSVSLVLYLPENTIPLYRHTVRSIGGSLALYRKPQRTYPILCSGISGRFPEIKVRSPVCPNYLGTDVETLDIFRDLFLAEFVYINDYLIWPKQPSCITEGVRGFGGISTFCGVFLAGFKFYVHYFTSIPPVLRSQAFAPPRFHFSRDGLAFVPFSCPMSASCYAVTRKIACLEAGPVL